MKVETNSSTFTMLRVIIRPVHFFHKCITQHIIVVLLAASDMVQFDLRLLSLVFAGNCDCHNKYTWQWKMQQAQTVMYRIMTLYVNNQVCSSGLVFYGSVWQVFLLCGKYPSIKYPKVGNTVADKVEYLTFHTLWGWLRRSVLQVYSSCHYFSKQGLALLCIIFFRVFVCFSVILNKCISCPYHWRHPFRRHIWALIWAFWTWLFFFFFLVWKVQRALFILI